MALSLRMCHWQASFLAACASWMSPVALASETATAYTNLYTRPEVLEFTQHIADNRTAFLDYAAAIGWKGVENISSEETCFNKEGTQINCTTLPVLVLVNYGNRSRSSPGANIGLAVATMWQFVNAAQTLLPGYLLKPIFEDSRGDGAEVHRILLDKMTADPHKYVMIISGNEDPAVAAATAGPGWRLPVMAGGARAFDFPTAASKFQYLFRTHSGAQYRLYAYPMLLQLCGYKSVGLIGGSTIDNRDATDLFSDRLHREGINVTMMVHIPPTSASDDKASFDFTMDIGANMIRETRTRVFLFTTPFQSLGPQFVCEMYRRNLGGLVFIGAALVEYKFRSAGGEKNYLKREHIQCTYWELKALYKNMFDLTGGTWLTARFAGEKEGPLTCLPQYQSSDALMWGRNPFVTGLTAKVVEDYGFGPMPPPANIMGNTACAAVMALRGYLVDQGRSASSLKARTLDSLEAMRNASSRIDFNSFDGRFRYLNGQGFLGPRYAHSLRTPLPDEFNAYHTAGMCKDGDGTLVLFHQENATRHADVVDTFEHVWKPTYPPPPYKMILVKRGGKPPSEQRSQCATQELPHCPLGTIYSQGVTLSGKKGWGCVECPAGKFQEGWHCKLCPPGEQSSKRSTQCSPCLPGSYSSEPGSESCSYCESGRFIAEARKTACAECELGRFTGGNKTGATQCEPCGIGFYANTSGLAECISCPGNLKTRYPQSTTLSDCACDVGHYLVHDSNDAEPQCKACIRGLRCETFGGAPLVDAGYFMFPTATRSAAELDLYQCMPSIAAVCPGQQSDISDPVCGKDMTGLNCGLCSDGFTRSGNECIVCEDSFWILPVFFFLFFLACGIFHGLWNRKAAHVEAAETVLASVTLGMTLGFIQQIGIFDRLQFQWPDAFQKIMDFFSIFLFELDLLAPSCFFSQGLASSYVTSMLPPIIVVLIFLTWLPLSQLLQRVSCGRLPQFKLAEILNSLGMVIQAIFIAIAASTVRLLECYKNPNGVETIRRYSYEVCRGDEYWKMMPVCIAGIIFYIFGIIAIFSYAAFVAPRKFVDTGFRASVRFLVFKYAPNRWWYGIVLLLRSLALAMVTVIEPQDGYIQFFMMLAILIASLFVHVVLSPYCDQFANNLESVEMCLLLAILGFGSWYITDRNQELDDELAVLLTTLFIVCALTLFIVFLYACFIAQFPNKAKAMHEDKVQQVLPNLRAMCNLVASKSDKEIINVMESATYIDRMHVYEMVAFMLLELEGVQSDSFMLMRLPTVTSSCEIVSKDELKRKLSRLSTSSMEENQEKSPPNPDISPPKEIEHTTL